MPCLNAEPPLCRITSVLPSSGVTWDQALFSFRFENYIPAGMAKRKESPILAVAVRENV